jgi:hypothetical protein
MTQPGTDLKAKIMATVLEDLVREVAESRTVTSSATVLLRGLKTALDAAIASGDMSAVVAAVAELDAQQADLAAAIVVNAAGGEVQLLDIADCDVLPAQALRSFGVKTHSRSWFLQQVAITRQAIAEQWPDWMKEGRTVATAHFPIVPGERTRLPLRRLRHRFPERV